MTSQSSKISGWTSRHSDGTPGLELYVAPWAFAWTGRFADPIEVSYGGYGEPTEYLIDMAGFPKVQEMRRLPLRRMLRWFEVVCREWAGWIESGDWQVEAAVVEYDHSPDAVRLAHKLAFCEASAETWKRLFGE